MIKVGHTYNTCDRCGKKLTFIKPVNACTVVTDGSMDVHVLCSQCLKELREFLDGTKLGDGHIHIPF